MKRRAQFLSAEERAALLAAVGGDDGAAARRANALLLLDRGKPVRSVAEALFLDPGTVRGWLEAQRAAAPPPPGAGGTPDAPQAPDGTGSTARAAAMFSAAVAHLLIFGAILPHPGFAVDAHERVLAVPGLLPVFAGLWALIAAEALWSSRLLRGGAGNAAARALLVCAVPPCRAAVRPGASGEAVWLPGFGWRRTGEALFGELERRSAFPMLCVTLLIVPAVAVEFLFEDRISASPRLGLAVHVANSVIWFFFALELVVMLSLAERKKQYCMKNWVNVVVVLMPFLGFLRTMRLFAAVGAVHSARLVHGWRLRGLLVRLIRIVLVLKLVERFMRRNPKAFLARLRARKEEKLSELDALDEEIRHTETLVAQRERQKADA